MIRRMMYRTEREGGGFTVSKERPVGKKYKIRWRLIAEEGMAITDGRQVATVIDVQTRKERDAWYDCEKPMDPEDENKGGTGQW